MPRRRSITGRPRGSTSRRSCTSPTGPSGAPLRRVRPQDHGLEQALDWQILLRSCRDGARARDSRCELDAADPQRPPHGRRDPRRRDRPALRRRGPARRHDRRRASPARPARASAPSWPAGITLQLEGDANDYLGKGLSGGQIVVYPPPRLAVRARGEHHRRQRASSTAPPAARSIINGLAGERFARAQQRRDGGGRGRGRPRLRVHDRRPRGRARAARASTSPPA